MGTGQLEVIVDLMNSFPFAGGLKPKCSGFKKKQRRGLEMTSIDSSYGKFCYKELTTKK